MSLHARVLALLTRRVVLRRGPDVVIGGNERPYLLRWYVIPRNRWLNIYLHKFCRSDDDRALHSHPWAWNASWLLSGQYLEILPADPAQPEGASIAALRAEGAFKGRWNESWHRVRLFGPADDETPVWTLFLTGPTIREWGFACPKGFKHWRDFTSFRTKGTGHETGPGCEDEA